MTHFVFIAASYGVALVGLAALALWLAADYARQRRALAELEARGLTRRSASVRNGAPAADAARNAGDTAGDAA